MTEPNDQKAHKNPKDQEAPDPIEVRFRAVVDGFSDPILMLDRFRFIRYANHAFLNVLDYQLTGVIGIPIEEFLPVDERQEFARYFEIDLPTSNSGRKFEHHLLKQNQGWEIVETTINPLDDPTGQEIFILHIHVITERKQAEEKLRESEAQYRYLFENNPHPMWAYDLNTLRFLAVNEAAIEKYGYTREEFLRMTIAEIRPTEDLQRLKEDLARPRTPLQHSSRWRHILKNGKMIDVDISSHTIELAGQTAVLVVALDITDRKRAELELFKLNAELEQRVEKRTGELKQLNSDLERANRTKSEFLANMSHELRSPLNSILGLSESLLEQRRGPLNESQQQYVETIETSGRHLLSLINDVLDLSKIEAGKFDFYPEVVQIDDICHSSIAFVKNQAVKKSIKLAYKNEVSISKISADPRRLKQILVNLLTNAVKFTPEQGQISLEVQTEPENNVVRLSVTDTGIGIAQGDLQKLFQPFVQVDSSLTRIHEGTGLGLALVQKLTDLHGGSIEVASTPHKGSRFTINLPWTPIPELQQPKMPTTSGILDAPIEADLSASKPNNGHGLILLAEDNAANILTIGEYLESHEYIVVVARDGLEALEKTEAIQPDIILMDIQMPSLDGLEATRRLRANPSFAATPIIALTALAMPGDRERCLAAGANEYMSKPVKLKSLVKMIQGFLDAKEQ